MQKLVQFFIVILLSTAISNALQETDEEVKQALDDWRTTLIGLQNDHSDKSLDTLQEALVKLSREKTQYASEHLDLYALAKKLALSHPNHAKYFIDQIEAERAKLPDGPIISGTRNDYNGLRLRIIRDTLRHLPSPQVVAALGKLLYDERDTPPKMRPGQDWIDAKSNAYQAAEALRNIGIRHAPVAKDSYNEEADLATWRLWWEQVQAGNKSFSFEGQDVAYRFTKQGSFEILTPDDDSQQNKAQGNADSNRKNPLSPQWIAVIIISMLALTGAYVAKRKKG